MRAATWGLVGLMVMATGLLLFPWWPKAHYMIQQFSPIGPKPVEAAEQAASAPQPPEEGNWLVIPSIGVKSRVWDGADISILDRKEGVWHQAGQPGTGNFVIAGHRFKYLPPNQTTFYNLDQLKPGDDLVVWWGGKRYEYTVDHSLTVGRNATEILNPTIQPELTLYTCTDLNASKRLVVVGRLRSSQ